jgi:hypothetical protein
MDNSGFVDEETIVKRILYKEKPDLRSLAQKCLELEKLDSARLSDAQLSEVFTQIYEEISSIELMTEKQKVLAEMYDSELDFHREKQAGLVEKIGECQEEVNMLKRELEEEKRKRMNLIEYEAQAKHINMLPRCDETMSEIEKVERKFMEKCKEVERKEGIGKEIEAECRGILKRIREIVGDVEKECGNSYISN